MTKKADNSFDIRDRLIMGLEKEIKIQQKLIQEQKTMIKLLDDQVSELTGLLKEILKTEQKG